MFNPTIKELKEHIGDRSSALARVERNKQHYIFCCSECKLAKSLDSNLTLSIKSEHAQTLAIAILLLGFFPTEMFLAGYCNTCQLLGRLRQGGRKFNTMR